MGAFAFTPQQIHPRQDTAFNRTKGCWQQRHHCSITSPFGRELTTLVAEHYPHFFSAAIFSSRSSLALLLFVVVLIYVPIQNPTRLKNGTQVSCGRNCCANASEAGIVHQATFMTGRIPARTVAAIWLKLLAPAMTAIADK